MKPSEMANEALARWLETVKFNYDVLLREAAARLRNATVREMAHRAAVEAYRREVKDLNSKRQATICDLRRRLKVAEDALNFAWMYADKLPHQWPLPERVRTKMKDALAAIRGEG